MLAPDDSWPQPGGSVSLKDGEIHVWRLCLTVSDCGEAELVAHLSQEERRRADRFLSEPARKQFIVARAGLRTVLSYYLERPPGDIAFRTSPLGKPGLADAAAGSLFFNLSHSRELALIALSAYAEIGVDVEQVREMASREQLAERFFHPQEVRILRSLSPEQRARGFFNAWTRKEAFLKATGKGISYGIDRVEVTLTPGEDARVLSIDGDREIASSWSLATLDPADGYVGAVALNGYWRRICRFSF